MHWLAWVFLGRASAGCRGFGAGAACGWAELAAVSVLAPDLASREGGTALGGPACPRRRSAACKALRSECSGSTAKPSVPPSAPSSNTSSNPHACHIQGCH